MSRPKQTGRLLLLAAFLGCALAIGLLMLKKYEDRQLAPTVSPVPQTGTVTSRVITLFFASPEGTGLVRESREVDSCNDPGECVREIVSELVKGPLGDLEPTLPAQTSVNGVSIINGIVTLDLGDSFADGLPGGSSSEMTAVYSIVDSIAVNVPGVAGVKFVIGGKDVPTLAGGLDLRRPLAPDFSLERPPVGTSGQSVREPAAAQTKGKP